MNSRSRDAASRLTTAEAAGERYFRLYYKHVTHADLDTLFNLLEGMHSLNDRLEKQTGKNFLETEDFLALKPLRNLFHHHLELLHEVKVIPATSLRSISTDLLYLCLVPRELVELAAREIRGKHRSKGEDAMQCKLKWYGSVVNINPCLFNFSVRAYERLKETDLGLTGAEYRDFEASYGMEAEAGHSHLVTGDIYCHAASVDEVLETVLVGEQCPRPARGATERRRAAKARATNDERLRDFADSAARNERSNGGLECSIPNLAPHGSSVGMGSCGLRTLWARTFHQGGEPKQVKISPSEEPDAGQAPLRTRTSGGKSGGKSGVQRGFQGCAAHGKSITSDLLT